MKKNNNFNNEVNNEIQYKVFDALRFPLCIFVVLIHTFLPKFVPDYNSWYEYIIKAGGENLYSYFIKILFSDVLARIAVPTFFIISGFLFFRNIKNWNKTIYINKIKSRFRSLFIPYIIWNTIPFIYLIIKYLITGHTLYRIIDFFRLKGFLSIYWNYREPCFDIPLNYFGTLISKWYVPLNGPLWFVKDLMICIILTPLIYCIIKKMKVSFLIILCLAYISNIWPNIFIKAGCSITALFFFSTGAFFAIQNKNIIEEFKKVTIYSYIFALSFGFAAAIFGGTSTYIGKLLLPFYIIFGVIAIFNIATFLIKNEYIKVNKFLAKSSFFIYCLHGLLILRFSNYIVNKIIPFNTTILEIIKYFMVPILTVCICLCIYYLLKRYFPKLLNILTGDR